MRISKTLADLAASTPSLLNGLVVSEFATARETMIRLACSESPALDDPPPALFHASTTPSANVLYGGTLNAAYDDVEYVQGKTPPMIAPSESVYCIGSGMVDVCKTTPRPAVLYAYRKQEGLVVRLVVYDCPLASMEVELFHGPPTSFERAWLGDGAKAQRALREKVHLWMRSRGGDHLPSFLYDRDQHYHTTRRGVLPFLRFRAPANENEVAILTATLEGVQPPEGGLATLKNLAGVSVDAIKDQKLFLETVFSSYAPERAPAAVGGLEEEVDFGSDGDDCNYVGCTQATKIPILGILALCMLKQTVEDHEEDLEEATPAPTFAQAEVDRALDEEAAQPALIRGLRVDSEEKPSSSTALAFAAPVLRICDSALIVQSSDPGTAACGLMTAVASEEDAALMAEHLGILKPGTLVDALSQVVAASKRQRFLICYPKSKVFLTNNGSFKVSDDAARRLLLCSWVTPLLVRYEKVSEVKVKGVSRETVELSSHFKRQVIVNRALQVPESVVVLMRDVSVRLVALEAATKAAPTAVVQVAPPSVVASSFKRVLKMVGGSEDSLAKRA